MIDFRPHAFGRDIAQYSNQEMRLYDRLGPKAKIAIGNAHRIIDIARVLAEFQRQRGPIEIDGDFYPAPAFNSEAGDADFARWIEKVVRSDALMSIDDLTLKPLRAGPVTRRAMRANAAIGVRTGRRSET